MDSDGTVTAIRPGKTVVTAKTSDGRKSTCTVEVIEQVKINAISIEPKSVTLNVIPKGAKRDNNVDLDKVDSIRLSVGINPSDATNKRLTWTSSDPKIATVDPNGFVKAVKGGTVNNPKKVTITATAQDGSGKKATCEVMVVAEDLTRFDDIPVYQTKTQMDSYKEEDYRTNDKEPDYFVEHKIYKCDKKKNKDGEYYYTGDIAKDDSKLFSDMKWLRGAASGKLTTVFVEMAEKFHSETEGTYQNNNLTNAVESDSNTVTYCNRVEKNLKEVIKEYKGDLSKLDYFSYSDRLNVPLVSRMRDSILNHEKGSTLPSYSDMTKGLGITVHGWISNNIYVDNFVMNANGDYSCTVRYEFYDVFGLDTADVEGNGDQDPYGKYPVIGQKFRAWYILQHLYDYSDANGYKSFKGKPFITKVEFTHSLSGTI